MKTKIKTKMKFEMDISIDESIEVNKSGRVRRAKLYYLRSRSGKSARIREKRQAVEGAQS